MRKETKGCQECWDPKETRVLLDHQGHRVQRVCKGFQGFREVKEQGVLEVDLEAPVTKVIMGLLVFLGEMDRQDCRDNRGPPGLQGYQDRQVYRGLEDLLDPLAHLVLRASRGCPLRYLLYLFNLRGHLTSANPQNQLQYLQR